MWVQALICVWRSEHDGAAFELLLVPQAQVIVAAVRKETKAIDVRMTILISVNSFGERDSR
jgi:hypothetical protein